MKLVLDPIDNRDHIHIFSAKSKERVSLVLRGKILAEIQALGHLPDTVEVAGRHFWIDNFLNTTRIEVRRLTVEELIRDVQQGRIIGFGAIHPLAQWLRSGRCPKFETRPKKIKRNRPEVDDDDPESRGRRKRRRVVEGGIRESDWDRRRQW